LRELAMRQAAYAIESRLPEEMPDVPPGEAQAIAADRLLLVLTPEPSTAALIRRGRRVADYLRADCLAVYVTKQEHLRDLGSDDRDKLERHLNFARALRIETRVLQGSDTAETIAAFARVNGVTQIFVTRQKSSVLRSWFAAAFVQRLVNLARDMQVTVVADRSKRPAVA